MWASVAFTPYQGNFSLQHIEITTKKKNKTQQIKMQHYEPQPGGYI